MSSGDRLSELERVDITAMSAGDAHAALRDVAVIRGTTDRVEAAITRRIAELHAEGKAVPPADALGAMDESRDARRRRPNGAPWRWPRLPDSTACSPPGRSAPNTPTRSASVAALLNDEQRAELFGRDDELTGLAASLSPDRSRRKVALMIDDITGDDGLDRAERQTEAATMSAGINDDTGMYWFRGQLAPEDGNRFRRAIDHEANALAKQPEHAGRRRDQLDASARSISSPVSGPNRARRVSI